MAGEHIIVAEESRFVQEVCKAVLEEHGYKITCSSNGLAAVNCPEIVGVNLLIIDATMPGWDGFVTAKTVRQTPEITSTPILLLVDESDVTNRESISMRGADAYLLKPFTPAQLVRKVSDLLEEHSTALQARERLAEVAQERITKLAEEQVQRVVEKRTQIIVERMIQHVIEAIDDKARREVDAKVTQLSAEKEQALIKQTVTEVARSMIDKQAEQRVIEAIESQLNDRLEKAARRAADAVVPAVARERVKDQIQSLLQREVQVRVQQAADNLVPDVSHKLIATVDTLAQKVVPKVARDMLPELAERQVQLLSSKTIPQQIDLQVRTQVTHQMSNQLQPQLMKATRQLWLRVILMNIVAFGAVAALIVWWFYKTNTPFPWQ